jgi:hypothetical protein
MRRWSAVFVVAAVATLAIGVAAAVDDDPVPLFTSEDLDRMFGPVPAPPSEPVDKSRPEDWRWVEDFLARQYSRIDADRQFELSSQSVDTAAEQVAQPWPYYGGSVAWGLGYPASTWWNGVWSKYRSSTSVAACPPRGDRFLAGGGSRGRELRGGGDRGRGRMNAQHAARSR